MAGDRSTRSVLRDVSMVMLGIAGGLVGAYVTGGGSRDQPPPSDPEIHYLRAEVAEMSAKMREDRAASSTRPVLIEGPPVESATSAVPLEERLRRAEVEDEARVSLLDGLIEGAPLSNGVEEIVLAGAEQYASGSPPETPDIVALRCSSTLCRIELAHEQQDSVQRMMLALNAVPGWSGEGFLRRYDLAGGGVRSVLFLAQNGNRLPSLAPGEPFAP